MAPRNASLKTPALALGALVLLTMLATTVWASLQQNIFACWPSFTRPGEPWPLATLVDAYLMFFLFWLWICYREPSVVAKGVWFVIMMLTGSMGAAGYLIYRAVRVRSEQATNEPQAMLLHPADRL